MSPEEIAMKVRTQQEAAGRKNPVPHPVLRFTTAYGLPALGVGGAELYRSGPDGHYTYKLPLPEPEPDWEEKHVQRTWAEWWTSISGALSEPIANPARN